MSAASYIRALAARIASRLLPSTKRRHRFTRTYLENYWRGEESRSGRGSSMEQTAAVRAALPSLCDDYSVRSLLDLPCGDCNWIFGAVPSYIDYIGADIVGPLIEENARRHAAPNRRFIMLDIVAVVPPRVDLVLCRDLLVHLPERDIHCVVANLKRSGSSYLLATNFGSRERNVDLEGADWRPMNLQAPPFSFPAPLRRIDERCSQDDGAYSDKELCLWTIADLP